MAICVATSPKKPVPKVQLAPFTETLPGTVVKIEMIPVPGGSVTVGSKTIEVKPFWIAKTETVWEAFDSFVASGPPSPPYDQTKFAPDAIARPSKSYILPDLGWGHHGFPAINISIDSATMFCRWVASVTKKKYRLPSQAEWELACRLGQGGATKLDKSTLDQSAWYGANSQSMTHAVGTKQVDKLGLFDMLGNVGEWAMDADGKPILCGGTFEDAADGISPSTNRRWSPNWQVSDPQLPKSRWWLADAPFAGFRIVCEP